MPTPTPTPTPTTPTPPSNFTLDLSKPLIPVGTGLVTDDKGKINCAALCLGANATYPSGTTVVLTAKADLLSAFAGWGGACSGTNPKCSVKMVANQSVTASFSLLGLGLSEPAVAPYAIGWTMQLDVSDGVGQVVFGGQTVQVARGPSQAAATARDGDNMVEAQWIEARGQPGTWRFEAQGEAIEPGSRRVARGEVALVTPTAVVFRLKGQRGEEVAFSYRLRR